MKRSLLLPALLVQAALLLPNLGLLPVWGDEQFTLSTIVLPIDRMLEAVGADVHPPLYYLVNHFWLRLPLPGSEIVRVRFLSVMVCLLGTIAAYLIWVRPLKPGLRAWFLALWVLSPFLLLYARMGRSYSMQLLFACLALGYGIDAGSRRNLLLYILWATILLYTHYLPGIAVTVAVSVYWIWRRGSFQRLVLAHAAVLLLYVPWLRSLPGAAKTAIASGDYRVTSSEVLEHGVRIAYTFMAATFGETLPVWAFVAALLVSPGVVWVLWHGARSPLDWLGAAAAAVVIGYAGVAAGVIFSLAPARLLFLLPFYFLLLVNGRERLPRAGSIVLGSLLILSLAGIASYYQRENFLNKGYVIPFDEIAAAVNRELPRGQGFLIVDGSNTQPTPLLAALPEGVRHLTSYDARALEAVRAVARDPRVQIVWFLRNTHDVTPERVNTQIESVLARGFLWTAQRSYVAYNAVDRAGMKLLGWPSQPSHVLEMLEFVRMEPQ